MEQELKELIQNLRDLAIFLEQHPGVPAPQYNALLVGVETREEMASVARLAAWDKDFSGDYFSLVKQFGTLRFQIFTDRNKICRRVVAGTRVVPAQPERIVEDVEWVCDEPLLAGER